MATPSPTVRAAQYLRMSTDRQAYSLDHQACTIAAYASEHGYTVTQTYADMGVSGLRLRGREGLQRLLANVLSGSADFSVILVYDVSRWGRFQDVDQAAHYEFLCRDAGIPVEYCAEAFDNDGSLSSDMLKHLRRMMAAEHSRELSVKITAAQRNWAAKGFWQGGPAGFGLRRLVVDRRGNPKALLGSGERKAIQSDRVILVPGPPSEVRTVRRIFRLFTRERLNQTAIAVRLNAQRVPYRNGKPWTNGAVREVLIAEKYAGTLVFHQTSSILGGDETPLPPEGWVRVKGAFQPIISQRLFHAAQALIRRHNCARTDEAMLEGLRSLLKKQGRLSARLINAAPEVAAVQVYIRRFGKLRHAYARIGYVSANVPPSDEPVPARRLPARVHKARGEPVKYLGAI